MTLRFATKIAALALVPFAFGVAHAQGGSVAPAAAGGAASSATAPTIDTNADGKPDAWDRDGNGAADAWDTNADGKPDAYDVDGDGKPDQAPAEPRR